MSGLEQRIHDAVKGQAQPTVTVLSSLLAVEDELGYIPREAVDFVAGFSKTTVNDVWAVASFYPNFRFEPPAEHVGELVERSKKTELLSAASRIPFSPSTTASTSRGTGREVNTASLPGTASFGLSAQFAPISIRLVAASRRRSWTVR